MIRLLSIACASFALASLAAGTVGAADAAKDRKDLLIEAHIHSGDLARAELANCYADANMQIIKLQADIAELKAAADKKSAPAAAQ